MRITQSSPPAQGLLGLVASLSCFSFITKYSCTIHHGTMLVNKDCCQPPSWRKRGYYTGVLKLNLCCRDLGLSLHNHQHLRSYKGWKWGGVVSQRLRLKGRSFNNRHLFLTVLNLGRPRSRCWQVWFLMRVFFLVSFSSCLHGRGEMASSGLFPL